MYKVSILVPFFNAGKYFGRCLRSLFGQTYPLLEFIFIDDASTDDSASSIKSIIEQFPNRANDVTYIRHDKNLGVAASRNEAIDSATGDFICFVDADDFIESDTIQLLVEKQQENDADMVWCNALMHTDGGDHLLSEPLYKDKHEMMLTYSSMARGYLMVVWRRLIRRPLLTEHNIHCIPGYNYAEDKVLMSQIAYYTQAFGHVDKALYHYNRMNESSLVAQRNHRLRPDLFKQELYNWEVTERFFSDKEPAYYEKSAIAKLLYLKEHLDQALQESSLEGFRIAVEHINATNPAFWTAIGWNRSKLHRRLYGNYFYMKYSPLIKRPAKKIYSLIKK